MTDGIDAGGRTARESSTAYASKSISLDERHQRARDNPLWHIAAVMVCTASDEGAAVRSCPDDAVRNGGDDPGHQQGRSRWAVRRRRGHFRPRHHGATRSRHRRTAILRRPHIPSGRLSVDVYPVNYPASLNFSQAGDGVADAANRVIDIVNTCPATKIVLGGYSQGAAIAAYITSDSVPARLRTPRRHHRTVATQRRPARRGRHTVRQALQRVPQPDRPRRPAVSIGPLYAHKTLDLCTPQDPVCSSGQGFSRAAHSAYKTNGMTDQAADFAANAIHGR